MTDFELCLYHETDKAWLVSEVEDAKDYEKFWLPMSEVEKYDDHKVKNADYAFFKIPEWLAKAKGLI